MKLHHIGWVALDQQDEPVRKPRRAGWDRKAGTNPPRIYVTSGMAKAQSPVKKCAAVFMRHDFKDTEGPSA